MKDHKQPAAFPRTLVGFFLVLAVVSGHSLLAQSLNIPSKKWGVSFGNSKDFTGLRFNFRDSRVERVTGVNFTLWMPRKDNKDAVVTGLSLGPHPRRRRRPGHPARAPRGGGGKKPDRDQCRRPGCRRGR